MEAGTPAEAMLLDWLNNRPSDDFFEKTLRLIRDILETRPPVVHDIREQSLGYYCNVVASASGGFLTESSSVTETTFMLMICFTGVLRSSWYICSMPSGEIHLPNNCGA